MVLCESNALHSVWVRRLQLTTIALLSSFHVEWAHADAFTPGNLVLSTRSRTSSFTQQLVEITQSGSTVQVIDIPRPGDDDARDVVIDSQGRAQVFNGTFDPYLSTFDPATGLWAHHTYPGWSLINNVTYGGIAAAGSFVYVTDQATFGPGDLPSGIVRFDLRDYSAIRFADGADYIDLNLGQDGMLYALGPSGSPGGTDLDVYDPNTLSLIRRLRLSSYLGLRAIAVDAVGSIYAVSLSDGVYRYSSAGVQQAHIDAYSLLGTYFYLEDIDLSSDGRLAIATDCGGVGTVDVSLDPVTTSFHQYPYCFPVWATFVPGGACPSTPVSLDVTPNTLNLRSMGRWVTATLEPEPPAAPGEIDVASVRLNGIVPVDPSAPTSIGDADDDGRSDLTVKFDRAAVDLTVAEGEAVPVTVSGRIGVGCFEATEVIRVIRVHVLTPSAACVLQGGTTTEVRWDMPAGVQAQSVALLWSSDDGASWTLVARDLPNIGSCPWTVPSTRSERARIAVILVEWADASGYEVSGPLGVSERFVIAQPLGVDRKDIGFGLQGLIPNPSNDLTVSFTLPDAEPATLIVYDVSGREVSRNSVGALGAGRHVVTASATRTLPTGMYLVYLIRADRQLMTRAVLVR